MSLVNAPLTRTGEAAPARVSAPVRAMQLGQHLIVLLLTAVGVVRAIGDGTPTPAAVVCGIAVLAWHTAGTILAASANSHSSRLVVWWLLGFAVIWLAVVVVSAEFVWLAFLLWLLAGHLLPLRWGLLFSGVVLAVVIVAPILHHGNTSYANVLGPVIGGVFAFGISRGYLQLLRDAAERERLVASLTNAQHEMAELQDELALAQRHSGVISERTRLSRDIHDTVAQGLSSIRLLSHAAGLRASDSEAKLTFSQVESLASDNLGEVRRIIAALAPTELEADALAAALDRLLDRVAKETGLQVELHADTSLPQLPTEVEVALLRTAQSALANVRLHAQASRVVVSLIDADDSVRLDIIDDGVGFDASEWDHRASEEGASSYGLRFMRARLRELGGGLDVESAPGEGTAVSAHLPIYLGPDASSDQTHRTNEERPMTINVLLVDDHPVVRSGLRAVLDSGAAVQVVGEAATGEEAITLAAHLRPDVVLCDLRLGDGIDGIETTVHLRRLDPAPAVLILTTYDRDAEILGAIEAGAAGYLLKDVNPGAILEAIGRAAAGETVLTPELQSRVLKGMREPLPRLTERETEVLRLLSTGATNREIARTLFVAEATVKSHIAHICTKLGVDSRSKAVHAAQQAGLI